MHAVDRIGEEVVLLAQPLDVLDQGVEVTLQLDVQRLLRLLAALLLRRSRGLRGGGRNCDERCNECYE